MVQKLILVIKKYFCVENISPYNISYKASTGPKPFCIKFDKIDGFIISLDGKIKHLVLFDYGLSDEICDKIKYLISQKSATTNRINYNFEKIKTDSYNSLPIKKILTVTIRIMLQYSLSQLLIRMKINTTIIYF